MTYDTRTLTQQERDDVAALRVCCDRLAEALDYQTRRADAMAAELAAHRATLQRLADWAQVVELQRGVTP
jgi:hypothetical protein